MNRLFIIPRESARTSSYIGKKSEPDSRVTLEPGHIYFIPADFNLEFKFCPGLALGGTHFQLEIMTGLDAFISQKEIMIREDQEDIGEIIWKTLYKEESLSKTTVLRGLIQTLAGFFIDLNIEDMSRIQRLQSKYKELFEWLSENRKAGITIKQLAYQSGLSTQTLSRNFSRDVGISLKEYYLRSLIQEISRLLVCSNSSMKEIAAQLSFNDEYYFSRFFSRRTGFSAMEYRRLYQK